MTAADSRYGRQGGRWALTRKGDDICATCRNATAAYEARHQHRNETWLSCGWCRTQTARYSVPVTFVPLIRTTCPYCGCITLDTTRPDRCPHCRHTLPEAA